MTVFERPGLREFLKQIGEFADLILFTAGIEGRYCSVRLIDLHGYPALFFLLFIVFRLHTGYASPLFDRIDVENRFSQRLFRPSTVST